jgi:DNA-binding NarL/FixJ family response regulator
VKGVGHREPFVGREREMETLYEALREAIDGSGRIVTLSGEPGIGKTRCAEELANLALETGATVLWGHCLESIPTPAYWPWVETLNELVRGSNDERLVQHLGPYADVIGKLLPAVRDRIPDLRPAAAIGDPESARFRLLDALCEFLRNVSASQPLLLVLEDLNWADAESLQLLELFATRVVAMHVLVVATYRDVELSRAHPLAKTLGDLVRERSFDRLTLRRLGESDMKALLDRTLRVPIRRDTKARLLSRTEGNPFFLVETVRQLNDETGGESVAEGIREAIGRRLDRLSHESNELLTVAAVIGREFSLEQLKWVVDGLDDQRGSELLEEAGRAGLTEATVGVFGHFRFAHAMIQETLVDEISLNRQVQMHARIGQALEALYGEGRGEHATELLHHFASAQSLVGNDKVIEYALIGGEQALQACAYDEAARCFQAGLECKGDVSMDDEKAALLFGYACARSTGADAGQGKDTAIEAFVVAFEHYAQTGREDKAVEVAVAGNTHGVRDLIDQGLLSMYERALGLVERDSVDEAHIQCAYASLSVLHRNDWNSATPAFERALALARRHCNPNLELWIFFRWGQACRDRGRTKRATELFQEADRVRGCDDPFLLGTLHNFAAHQVFSSSSEHVRTALPRAEAAYRISLRTNHRRGQAVHLLTMLHHMLANWDEARRYNDINLDLSQEPVGFPTMMRVFIDMETGNAEAGELLLSEVGERVARFPDATEKTGAFTYCAPFFVGWGADRRHLETAERAARFLPDSLRESLHHQPHWNIPVTLAHISAVRCDPDHVMRERYNAFLESVDPDDYIVYDRHRYGIIAGAAGDFDAAIEHFRVFDEFHSQIGAVRDVALRRYDVADVYMKLGDPESLRVARNKLSSARSLAEQYGMVMLQRLVDERLAVLDSVQTETNRASSSRIAHQNTAGLTAREIQVLRHIAVGKTNQETATALFISEKTVHNHLSHIFAKLGVGNRTEATRVAIRLGLEPVEDAT